MALDYITTVDAAVGAPISLDDAISWTASYQKAHQNELRAVYFSREVFETLLKQAGTQGIRIYLANDGSKDTMVLASATASTDLTSPEYQLYDQGSTVPPGTVTSPLNQ